jgi:hypothetical protein
MDGLLSRGGALRADLRVGQLSQQPHGALLKITG